MNFWIKSRVRTVQAALPGVWDIKHVIYNAATKHFGLMMDDEFKLLGRMGQIDLVLDIGGNFGQSIHAVKKCSKPNKIISFEPISKLANSMKENFRKDKSVQIENIALSNEKSNILFIYHGINMLP